MLVEPSGDLRVVLRGAGEVLLFGAPPYRTRLVTFLGLRQELAERCPGAEYFDLRFRDRIYAKQPKVPVTPPSRVPPHPPPGGGARARRTARDAVTAAEPAD